MTDRLPKFDSPPIVETVLSVQFARLEKFSNAHAGWFWKGSLGKDWATVQAAPRLDDQFERFGDETQWRPAGGGFRISQAIEPARLQISRADNERMIQIQDSRFVYNWRKQGGDYPSYEKLRPEFEREFAAFEKFAEEAGLGHLDLKQWEVTYVNHIPKGDLWQSFQDWPSIFPGFLMPAENVTEVSPEDFHGEWRLAIPQKRGRLYISVSQGRIGSEKGLEVIRLQLMARGPVDIEKGVDLQSGLDLGHESIVLCFAAITSDTAHKHWKRRV